MRTILCHAIVLILSCSLRANASEFPLSPTARDNKIDLVRWYNTSFWITTSDTGSYELLRTITNCNTLSESFNESTLENLQTVMNAALKTPMFSEQKSKQNNKYQKKNLSKKKNIKRGVKKECNKDTPSYQRKQCKK
jgi:hypothetical protein